MFLILGYFCYEFFRRAMDKGHAQAQARAVIYALCGTSIGIAILALAIDNAFHVFTAGLPRFTYYGEALGLVSFGISWLTASRVLPVLTRQDERFSPFRRSNPA
jgi:uncharacterized YccA/Bax inhibitor family protein